LETHGLGGFGSHVAVPWVADYLIRGGQQTVFKPLLLVHTKKAR
jgi:hypothetical protein